MIAIEDLNVLALWLGVKARSVHDAGCGLLIHMLAYKAEKAGRQLVRVDPRDTSQACSGCGVIVPKDWGVRMHNYLHCGLSLDRDHNAAINILNRAVMRPGFAKPSCVAA